MRIVIFIIDAMIIGICVISLLSAYIHGADSIRKRKEDEKDVK